MTTSRVGTVVWTAARIVHVGGNGNVTVFITNTTAHVADGVRVVALNCKLVSPADTADGAALVVRLALALDRAN